MTDPLRVSEMRLDPALASDLRALAEAASRLAQHLENGLALPETVERHQFDDRAKEYLR